MREMLQRYLEGQTKAVTKMFHITLSNKHWWAVWQWVCNFQSKCWNQRQRENLERSKNWLFRYSKSPTCEPSRCKVSKMWTCVCMSNYTLVHVWHTLLHACIFYKRLCFCIVLYRGQWYSIFISSPGSLEASVKAAVM